MDMPTTLLIGLGNPILGDDGVGWRVVEALQSEGLPPQVEAVCLAAGGLRLMEAMLGYAQVVIVDAFAAPGRPPGQVFSAPMSALPIPDGGHLTSSHDTSLPRALEMARHLGLPTPCRVAVVGIVVHPTLEFSEMLSPPVAAAIPKAKVMVRRYIWFPPKSCAVSHSSGNSTANN
ncbi:MAG: hydrogenase maturation protease [Anaerolineales bacterium]